jgi:endoglucanase
MLARAMRPRRPMLLVLVLLGVTLIACSPGVCDTVAQPAVSLAVRSNQLVNWAGEPVVLRGADTSGSEYACVSEKSIFDGSEEASESSIDAMQAWGFDAARVELNESCWLGVQNVKAAYSGRVYQQAIERYVADLNAAGMYVIIDLHFSSTGAARKATGQEPMPDERYAPAFWSSVAEAFKGDPAVILDLFNEPYPNHNTDSQAAWKCDLEGSAGGTCSGFKYQAAGMQQLLNAVRGTGATNVVMIGGPQFAGDLDQWLQYEPVDPLHQLAASIHIYWKDAKSPEFSPCFASSCWREVLAPLSTRVPIVVGEFGELDCADALYPPFLDFADSHGISYLAWAWFVGSCAREPSLISDYSGTATAYGVGYREHLAQLGLGSLGVGAIAGVRG